MGATPPPSLSFGEEGRGSVENSKNEAWLSTFSLSSGARSGVGRVHFPEAPLRKECKGESEVERLYAAAQKRCFVKNSEE